MLQDSEETPQHSQSQLFTSSLSLPEKEVQITTAYHSSDWKNHDFFLDDPSSSKPLISTRNAASRNTSKAITTNKSSQLTVKTDSSKSFCHDPSIIVIDDSDESDVPSSTISKKQITSHSSGYLSFKKDRKEDGVIDDEIESISSNDNNSLPGPFQPLKRKLPFTSSEGNKKKSKQSLANITQSSPVAINNHHNKDYPKTTTSLLYKPSYQTTSTKKDKD